jgi:hypothetical protein
MRNKFQNVVICICAPGNSRKGWTAWLLIQDVFVDALKAVADPLDEKRWATGDHELVLHADQRI